jgi:hypothetical protein
MIVVEEIVVELLRQVRIIYGLVDVGIKVTPYLPFDHQLHTLHSNLVES